MASGRGDGGGCVAGASHQCLTPQPARRVTVHAKYVIYFQYLEYFYVVSLVFPVSPIFQYLQYFSISSISISPVFPICISKYFQHAQNS